MPISMDLLRRRSLAPAALSALLVWPVFAEASVEVRYAAEVVRSSGRHAGEFPAGTPLSIVYRLNTSVPDSEPEGGAGIFFGAVASMIVEMPALGLRISATPSGNVQTFDDAGNVDAPDQVFFFGGPTTANRLLGGDTINSVEVDFLSIDGDMTLIRSDALPTTALRIEDAFVIIGTGADGTFVNFAAVGGTPVFSCQGLPATIIGSEGNDRLNGTAGADVITGLGGNDVIDGRGGDDVICGDAGRDTVRGGGGRDRLSGGVGDDMLSGGSGDDDLEGDDGGDALIGGLGVDNCDAGDDVGDRRNVGCE